MVRDPTETLERVAVRPPLADEAVAIVQMLAGDGWSREAAKEVGDHRVAAAVCESEASYAEAVAALDAIDEWVLFGG